MLKKLTPEKLLYGIFIGLLAYMPFHLFLSRWLSLYTGGLGQWDAAKDIVTVLGLGLAVGLAFKHKLFKDRFFQWIMALSVLYGALHIVYFIFNRHGLDQRSFVLGTLFNGRLLAYLFIGMVVARTYKELAVRFLLKIVIVTSTLTALFALAQYVLPKDLMTHFGYSIHRGVMPAFFIDGKPDFPRVMSTIRDPNSYGAFMILPIVVLYGWWDKAADRRNRLLLSGLILLQALALFLTFSRGAWIGLIIGIGVATYFLHRHTIVATVKKHLPLAGVGLVVLLAGVVYFRNASVVQNILLHRDQSTVMTSPNQLRIQVQHQAIDAIGHNPLGYGPGTAGLVSIGSPKGTFLPENYFLQIAYELGLVGLAIFLGILFLVYRRVKEFLLSESSIVRIAVLSSFWAYLFIATLIQLWSNESVAAQWWLLAGVLAGMSPIVAKKNQPPIRTKRS